jgi:dihydrofolate synthase / folylpolyglutamate synthase
VLFDRLLDLEKKPAARPYGAGEYRLDLFEAWLESLGSPHRQGLFLHLAGTKGKGSTSAICEGILRGMGYPTALFSSPHLTHYGERYRFDGQCWSEEEFLLQLAGFEEGLSPEQRHGLSADHTYRTVFEVLTALALTGFKQFSEEQALKGRGKPTVSILETGLGGRLDCTNVVIPQVSVITTLGIDHSHLLGDTIEKITVEKAGIIKPGRPVIVARQQPEFFEEIWSVLMARAGELGSPLIRAWEHNPVEKAERHPEGLLVSMTFPDGSRGEGVLPLRGMFQVGNLEAAVAACWYLAREQKLSPSAGEMIKGWEMVSWPGRLEVLSDDEGRQLVLDGAHCPLSARALGVELRALHRVQDQPWSLVFGMQGDKAAESFLGALVESMGANLLNKVIVFPVGGVRGGDPEEIARLARKIGLDAQSVSSPHEALQVALDLSPNIVVSGSLYCLEVFRREWGGMDER